MPPDTRPRYDAFVSHAICRPSLIRGFFMGIADFCTASSSSSWELPCCTTFPKWRRGSSRGLAKSPSIGVGLGSECAAVSSRRGFSGFSSALAEVEERAGSATSFPRQLSCLPPPSGLTTNLVQPDQASSPSWDVAVRRPTDWSLPPAWLPISVDMGALEILLRAIGIF